MAIVFTVLLVSFLIFMHEFGHFITAKLFRVQVREFALFRGPAVWKKQIGETLYSVRCIPVGGYCTMEEGEADGDFRKAVWWKQILILLAGAIMNILVGWLFRTCPAVEAGSCGPYFQYLLNLSDDLAINLGLINLLPLPGLDGGRIVAVLITTIHDRLRVGHKSWMG